MVVREEDVAGAHGADRVQGDLGQDGFEAVKGGTMAGIQLDACESAVLRDDVPAEAHPPGILVRRQDRQKPDQPLAVRSLDEERVGRFRERGESIVASGPLTEAGDHHVDMQEVRLPAAVLGRHEAAQRDDVVRRRQVRRVGVEGKPAGGARQVDLLGIGPRHDVVDEAAAVADDGGLSGMRDRAEQRLVVGDVHAVDDRRADLSDRAVDALGQPRVGGIQVDRGRGAQSLCSCDHPLTYYPRHSPTTQVDIHTAPRHIVMVGAALVSHTRPHVPLLTELVARGHRVTCALVRPLHPIVAATGGELLDLPAVPVVSASGTPGAPTEVDGLHYALEEAIVTLPVLLDAFSEDPPDLVLNDSAALAGPVLAACVGVPSLQLNVHFTAWEGFEDVPRAERRTVAEYLRYRERFARWLEQLGVRLHDHDAVLERPERLIESPARGLATIPRALQPHADQVDARWEFVPMLDDARLAAEGWSPPAAAAGRPVLLVAFGTAHNRRPEIYGAVIEAFGDGEWHVVLAVGDRVDRSALPPVPACIEIHGGSCPQLAVLAHADCFITHAGGASVTEALWNAVPMVAVPMAVDQFMNADQVATMGAGYVLPERVANAAALRRAVEGVRADPDVRRQLAIHQAALRAAGGAARAADVVEAALR